MTFLFPGDVHRLLLVTHLSQHTRGNDDKTIKEMSVCWPCHMAFSLDIELRGIKKTSF